MNFDDDDDDAASSKKKRRKMTTSARYVKPSVMSRFVGVDTSNVTRLSELFAGREMCVLNTSAGRSKADVEKKVVEYGGTIAQNPGTSRLMTERWSWNQVDGDAWSLKCSWLLLLHNHVHVCVYAEQGVGHWEAFLMSGMQRHFLLCF